MAQYLFSGKVTDEKGESLPGAQVILSRNDSLYAASSTGKNGRFALAHLPQGEYGLQILFPGYTPVEEVRRIDSDQEYTFSLVPEMNVELANVDVTANRSDRVERTATGQVFYLSEKAKNSGDPFIALREIPRLMVNDALKSVQMEDGSTPHVLINGMAVNSGISPIDPKDIESVEVVDVVGARYLRTGATHILNIKLKEKRDPYRYFEVATRHEVPWRKGMGVVYFEVENSKYSLYGRGSASYLWHDDWERSGWQQSTGYYKQSVGVGRQNNHSYLGELLFKWMATPKDYFVLHLYGTNQKEDSDETGEGHYQTAREEDFTYRTYSENLSNILTGSFYHKHSFQPEQFIETTLAFNGNWNNTDGERSELYPDWQYRDLFKYKNRRSSATLNVDYSWDITETNSFNAGSETRYVNDHIDEITSPDPLFLHREWSEYLYASFSGKARKLYYMLSAGLEGFRLKAGEKQAGYFRPRVSVSGTYNISDAHSLRLGYTLTNQAPEVGQLNPYNTSTDSLVISVGNPNLLPLQKQSIDLSYTFNHKGFYLTPSGNYTIYTDMIEPYGYTQDDIYINTYRNEGKYRQLQLGGTVSYRLGNWGRIYAQAYHNVDYFEGLSARKSFSWGAGYSATYKQWFFGGDVYVHDRSFTATSMTKNYTPTYSQAQVNYTFFPGFYIALALQYFHGPQHTGTWTYGGDYRSYASVKYNDCSLRPWILIRYTFRKNAAKKIKLGGVVSSKESGIKLKK